MIRIAVVLVLLFGLAGCADAPTQCSESEPCGFGEICVDGTCQGKICANSSQCAMEEYCSGGECRTGCAADSDCYPGDACSQESQVCEAAECRDSKLDCDYKEFCNSATGDCYEASGYYCRACVNDDDCGGNGNVCLGWGVRGDFCGVTCEVESDCPSGFTCIDVTDGAGNPLSSQCITYCWLYDDDARSPASPLLPPVIGIDDDGQVCQQEAL